MSHIADHIAPQTPPGAASTDSDTPPPDEEGQARDALGIVDRLLTALSAPEDVRDLLEKALALLCAELPGALGGAYLVADDAGGRRAAGREILGGSGPLGVPLASLLHARAVSGGAGGLPERLGLLDLAEDAAAGAALQEQGCGAVVLVPLCSGERAVGCLALGFAAAPAEEELTGGLYGVVGRAIGLAIDNASLVHNVNQRLRRSQALYKVSHALASTLDLDHLLSMIVTFAVDTVDKATNGVLHLLDESTGELHPRALSFQPGILPDVAGSNRMRLGHGVAGTALEAGQLVNIPDVSADPRFVRSAGSRRFAAMAVAPLTLGERRIGTLSIDSPEVEAFDEEDEQLLATLATMAAVAIDNARLVADLQQSLNHLRTTQEQLIQSAKLSAVGQLISGVAHELNNPLTAIMGYAQLLQMTEGLDESAYRDLDKVYVQARRAADIVQNLLTFARQRKQEASLVDVNDVLRRTVELRAFHLRRGNVHVTTHLGEGVGVMAAPDHLQQVFLQLLNNAQDAMRDVEPKELTITTRRLGGAVRISVADNGLGLSEEVRQHLFEPFFTTKDVGQGTGLGLSICFGIVNQYGGRIWAEGEPGRGATFHVEFPAPDAAPAGAAAEEGDTRPPLGARRLLVAAAREDVAKLLEVMLQQQGHCVTLVGAAEAALARADAAKGAGEGYDALLADVDLPDLDAAGLLRRLRRIDADLARRVLFIGSAEMDEATARLIRERDLPYVERPFDTEDLQQALEKALPFAVR